ncbi:hypothetical protein CLOM_g5641 [Closterium sp. NIES-68]|nr:hypothetical protein CLOM_g5641 [Closterium sp. NIES-68]GJP63992.1 hypothetical protein CLOP_g21031 [Closterium sp. NIES-67]
MGLLAPRFSFWLLLVVYASIGEGLRVLDDAAVKLTGPQTRTKPLNAGESAARTRPARSKNAFGTYQGHVGARLQGVDGVRGVIRVVVFRNTTSVNIRYLLRLVGLNVKGLPTAAGIVSAKSNALVVNFPSKSWSNVTNSPPFDLGWIKQGNTERKGLLYKYTSSGWCYNAGSVAAEGGVTVAAAVRGLMASPWSYYGTIVAPGGRANGVFTVQPLADKVSHGGSSS